MVTRSRRAKILDLEAVRIDRVAESLAASLEAGHVIVGASTVGPVEEWRKAARKCAAVRGWKVRTGISQDGSRVWAVRLDRETTDEERLPVLVRVEVTSPLLGLDGVTPMSLGFQLLLLCRSRFSLGASGSFLSLGGATVGFEVSDLRLLPVRSSFDSPFLGLIPSGPLGEDEQPSDQQDGSDNDEDDHDGVHSLLPYDDWRTLFTHS